MEPQNGQTDTHTQSEEGPWVGGVDLHLETRGFHSTSPAFEAAAAAAYDPAPNDG